jgi:hypothetical protein
MLYSVNQKNQKRHLEQVVVDDVTGLGSYSRLVYIGTYT